MAKTNSERQAAFRQKHLKGVDGALSRINILVEFKAKLALERLAFRYGVTQKVMLEKMIFDTEQVVLLGLADGGEQSNYYDKKMKVTP